MRQSITKDGGDEKDGSAGGSGGGKGGLPGVKSIALGAATSVWAATARELAGRGGGYLADRTEATRPAARAIDPVAARRLWAMSEGLVGETLDV